MKGSHCPARALMTKTTSVSDCQTSGNPDIRMYCSTQEIPLADWHGLVPGDFATLRLKYLATLEEMCADTMSFRYFLFYVENKPVAFAYFQIFSFHLDGIASFTQSSSGNTIFHKMGHAISRSIKGFFSKSPRKLILCGNAYLTGNNGYYHLDSVSEDTAVGWLLTAIDKVQNEDPQIFGAVIKDYGEPTGNALLLKKGYHIFQGDPSMSLHPKSEWKDFETYLGAMQSKYRQRAKSAYKKSEGLVKMEMSLEELESLKEEVNELYNEVVKEDTFSLIDIPKDYFCTQKRRLGDSFKILGYFLDGRLVAFSTAFIHENQMDGHFIGYRKELNRDIKLYQRLLYDFVADALELGVSELCLGRTAMEIKSTVGALPADFPLYLRIKNNLINRMITPLMKGIKMPDWESRHPFKT